MSEPDWINFIKKSGLEEGYLPGKEFLELTKKETEQIKEALVEIGF
jgi:tripartite-type tricarboxylate transporter receptor subunit TctC